jgi:hypothetical protein
LADSISKNKIDIKVIFLPVTTTQPVSARIYLVKLDKDNLLSKKEQYALRDVRFVDGVNPRKPVPDFNLTIQSQLYQLASNTHEEKEFFIRQLFKVFLKLISRKKT